MAAREPPAALDPGPPLSVREPAMEVQVDAPARELGHGQETLLVVTADDTLKDPGEDPCSMYHGGTGVSEVFPPRAYCRFGDGGTLDLAPGTQVVFWVCFTVSVVLLALGLAWAVRDPRAVVRRFHRADRG